MKIIEWFKKYESLNHMELPEHLGKKLFFYRKAKKYSPALIVVFLIFSNSFTFLLALAGAGILSYLYFAADKELDRDLAYYLELKKGG
jgi:hypothetical protein